MEGRRTKRGSLIPPTTHAGRVTEGSADPDQTRSPVYRWANSPLNHALDRAGRHRRLAAGLVATSFAVAVLTADVFGRGGSSALGLAHLLVLVGSAWLAVDLYRTGRMIDDAGRPHRSWLVLAASLGAWAVARPATEVSCGGAGWAIAAGGLVAVAGMATLAEADRVAGSPLIGRVLTALGGALVGAGAVTGAVIEIDRLPLAAIGLAVLGVAATALAIAEARLVVRSLRYLAD